MRMERLMNFKEAYQKKVEEIERILRKYLPEKEGFQKVIMEAMEYSLMAGGKRLRPMLMQETYRLFGGNDVVIEPFMAAIEMIHTYSLVHDDLPAMDNDDYRRGRKTKIAGIPLVSIRLSRRLGKGSVAKGIIAIGNVSVGVISIGILSTGIFSFGCLALGALALGVISVGIAALGVVAFGLLAFGTAAVGVYAGGVAVYGSQIAVGVAAGGKTVIGESTRGIHELTYYDGIAETTIRRFLLEHHPGLWKPLLDFFTMIGMNIK